MTPESADKQRAIYERVGRLRHQQELTKAETYKQVEELFESAALKVNTLEEAIQETLRLAGLD